MSITFGTGNDRVNEVVRMIPSRDFISGVKLESIKIEKNEDTNQKNLSFNFKQQSTGAIFKHIEFDPSVKAAGITDEKHQKQVDWQMSRFKHIMGRFMPEEQTIINNVNSWEEFIQQVGTRMKNAGYQNFECTLKLVYNKKDYASFPIFPPFISTEQYPREFEISPAYDKFEKSDQAASASSTPTASSSGDAFEDDPFDDTPEEQGTEPQSTENVESQTPPPIDESSDDVF